MANTQGIVAAFSKLNPLGNFSQRFSDTTRCVSGNRQFGTSITQSPALKYVTFTPIR